MGQENLLLRIQDRKSNPDLQLFKKYLEGQYEEAKEELVFEGDALTRGKAQTLRELIEVLEKDEE